MTNQPIILDANPLARTILRHVAVLFVVLLALHVTKELNTPAEASRPNFNLNPEVSSLQREFADVHWIHPNHD